jgi:hypothetical protein
MRRVVTTVTALPLLLLVYNLSTHSPQAPSRRSVPVTSSMYRRLRHSAATASLPPLPPSPPTGAPAGVVTPAPTTQAAAPTDLDACNGTEHMELWGSLVQPGNDNIQPTAADCCQSCRSYDPTLDVLAGAQCNTWVWHPQTHHCWLKHQKPAELEKAAAAIEARRRDRSSGATHHTQWQSGVWLEHKPCVDCVAPAVYNGCIGKDRCNTSRACGSPAIDGYSHVVHPRRLPRHGAGPRVHAACPSLMPGVVPPSPFLAGAHML